MKYDFGDYSIVGSVTVHFKKAPYWWWKIRPVTSGDELAMTNFIYRNRDIVDGFGVSHYMAPSNIEVCHHEIAMLFDGTNIPAEKEHPVEEGGKPVMEVGANPAEIEELLRAMPHSMVMELWDAIGQANPDGKWGPIVPKSEGNSTPESSG